MDLLEAFSRQRVQQELHARLVAGEEREVPAPRGLVTRRLVLSIGFAGSASCLKQSRRDEDRLCGVDTPLLGISTSRPAAGPRPDLLDHPGGRAPPRRSRPRPPRGVDAFPARHAGDSVPLVRSSRQSTMASGLRLSRDRDSHARHRSRIRSPSRARMTACARNNTMTKNRTMCTASPSSGMTCGCFSLGARCFWRRERARVAVAASPRGRSGSPPRRGRSRAAAATAPSLEEPDAGFAPSRRRRTCPRSP